MGINRGTLGPHFMCTWHTEYGELGIIRTNEIPFHVLSPITSDTERCVWSCGDKWRQWWTASRLLWSFLLRNYHRSINNNSGTRKEELVSVKLWAYLKCWVFIVFIVCRSTVASLPKYFSVVINMGSFENIRALFSALLYLAFVTCTHVNTLLQTFHTHNTVPLLCQERQSCLTYP